MLLLLTAGCSTWDRLTQTEKGAITGGAIGTGAGAIIGNQSGHPGSGAAIGGGIGALTGGLIGRGQESAARTCPAGQYYDRERGGCYNTYERGRAKPSCPSGTYWDEGRGACFEYPAARTPSYDCPPGQRYDENLGRCYYE